MFDRPGDVLLSHTLRCSTIGAEGFHGRVRDGIGCRPLAITTRPAKDRKRDSHWALIPGLKYLSSESVFAGVLVWAAGAIFVFGPAFGLTAVHAVPATPGAAGSSLSND